MHFVPEQLPELRHTADVAVIGKHDMPIACKVAHTLSEYRFDSEPITTPKGNLPFSVPHFSITIRWPSVDRRFDILLSKFLNGGISARPSHTRSSSSTVLFSVTSAAESRGTGALSAGFADSRSFNGGRRRCYRCCLFCRGKIGCWRRSWLGSWRCSYLRLVLSLFEGGV